VFGLLNLAAELADLTLSAAGIHLHRWSSGHL
jgi:hypothetical protein